MKTLEMNSDTIICCSPDDFGDVAFDVNYLDTGGETPKFQIFICWPLWEGSGVSIYSFTKWKSICSIDIAYQCHGISLPEPKCIFEIFTIRAALPSIWF